MLLQNLDKDEQALYETYRKQGQSDTEARASAVIENIRRQRQARDGTGAAMLKESWIEMFRAQGKTAEEAEHLAAIAIAGRSGSV